MEEQGRLLQPMQYPAEGVGPRPAGETGTTEPAWIMM